MVANILLKKERKIGGVKMYIAQKRSPVSVFLLSIVTCGIYYIWWNYTTGDDINKALGREAVKTSHSIIGLFCFPFLIYYAYQIDKAQQELCASRGLRADSNFTLWIITMLFGFGNIIYMIQSQSIMNDIWDASINMGGQNQNMQF